MISLFGMKINNVDMASAVETVTQWCSSPREQRCRYVVTPNVDHAVMFQHDTALQEVYAGAGLVLADGAPVVLASRLLKKALPERVAGSDLVPALFEAASQKSDSSTTQPLRVFLLGAGPGVADRAAKVIHERWAGVEVVGTLSPPMGFEHDDAENERILQAVADCQPDLVLIGLGAPKARTVDRSPRRSPASQGRSLHRRDNRLYRRRKESVATLDAETGTRMVASRVDRAQTLGKTLCPRRLGFSHSWSGTNGS